MFSIFWKPFDTRLVVSLMGETRVCRREACCVKGCCSGCGLVMLGKGSECSEPGDERFREREDGSWSDSATCGRVEVGVTCKKQRSINYLRYGNVK